MLLLFCVCLVVASCSYVFILFCVLCFEFVLACCVLNLFLLPVMSCVCYSPGCCYWFAVTGAAHDLLWCVCLFVLDVCLLCLFCWCFLACFLSCLFFFVMGFRYCLLFFLLLFIMCSWCVFLFIVLACCSGLCCVCCSCCSCFLFMLFDIVFLCFVIFLGFDVVFVLVCCYVFVWCVGFF